LYYCIVLCCNIADGAYYRDEFIAILHWWRLHEALFQNLTIVFSFICVALFKILTARRHAIYFVHMLWPHVCLSVCHKSEFYQTG